MNDCFNLIQKSYPLKTNLSRLVSSSKLKKVSKRKVQIYLAGMKDICNSIGLGAEKKYWNFDSEVYNELKSFLKRLSI